MTIAQAEELVSIIREGLNHDDGQTQPWLWVRGERGVYLTLNPDWVEARSRNITAAILATFDLPRGAVVAGEIETKEPDHTEDLIR